MSEEDPYLEHRPNKLLRKIPNPEALSGKPDLFLIQKLDAVVARERKNYIPEMARQVEHLVRLLRQGAEPSEMWPVAHEMRGLAGTFGFTLLSDVARIFCGLVQDSRRGMLQGVLPDDVADVFAAALLRARDATGEYSTEEEAILLGLRMIAAREAKARAQAEGQSAD